MGNYNDNNYILTQLSQLENTGVFLWNDGIINSYQDNTGYNPLYNCRALQEYIKKRADKQSKPCILCDEHYVYFSCVKAEEGYYMVGPMSTEIFNPIGRHKFYNQYGIPEENEKNLWRFTMMEILRLTCLIAKIVTGEEYTDQELVDTNNLAAESKDKEDRERILYMLQSEEEESIHHSYMEEKRLLEMVKEGNAEEAVRMAKEMDQFVGRLAFRELDHWKNVLTVGAALCARAAIEVGVAPYIAYRISGFYIIKGTECMNAAQVLIYRNHAIEELAQCVKRIKDKRKFSVYTTQCMDYIHKHYREKIYLEDIAQNIEISVSYLSRLFKKETGICVQDYINKVKVERASNLLIYSEEPIPKIAHYVNFPSQSYFGKIFKEHTGMTPKQFRDANKPSEFIEKKK